MSTIALNLAKIHQQITTAELQYQRVPNSVQLLAVSKGQSVTAIQQAIITGQRAFGENYVQEAIPKITALGQEQLEWHFIGAIQANKTRLIAHYFHWVHSLDRFAIAERLSNQRHPQLAPLNVCIQVNLDEESNKAGVRLTELPELAQAIVTLPRLKLRGLMAIPAPQVEEEQQRATFHKMYLALDQLQKKGLALDTLSMGMSHDFIAAIAEGATIIRLGTAIFGERL